ncbi:hypothetical protein DFH09DRAFT_1375705, partial [Mycena vulgaris]
MPFVDAPTVMDFESSPCVVFPSGLLSTNYPISALFNCTLTSSNFRLSPRSILVPL